MPGGEAESNFGSGLFSDPAEELAYESFVASQEPVEEFSLDAPALVCRWRMANKKVPMLNRHIRALSQRKVNGEPLTHNMLSWAKQHVEWSLCEGAYDDVNGVLMLVIDVNGNAAMTVGGYEPLPDDTLRGLFQRAKSADAEAEKTGVAPELLAAVAFDTLTICAQENDSLCGTATLVEQLAKTKGFDVNYDPDPLNMCGDAFLISDEHGIVPASDGNPNQHIDFLKASYEKLLQATK